LCIVALDSAAGGGPVRIRVYRRGRQHAACPSRTPSFLNGEVDGERVGAGAKRNVVEN